LFGRTNILHVAAYDNSKSLRGLLDLGEEGSTEIRKFFTQRNVIHLRGPAFQSQFFSSLEKKKYFITP
jgi:hypothetical protein